MAGPTHIVISEDSRTAAQQNGENARATIEALASKLSARVASVASYTAAGATTTKIPLLGGTAAPTAVVLLRAFKVSDPGADLGASSRLNFSYDGATQTLNVYEPSGLTANVAYTLVFLIVE